MNRYLLGFDVGSSSVKASLVDADNGQCAATAFYPETEAPIKAVKAGWAEQSPDDWWLYLKQALKKVIVKISDITEDHNPDCCAVVICGRSGDHKVIIPRTQAIKPNVLKESCELCARLYLDAAQSQETEYGNWDAENFCGRIRYKDNTEESYEVVKIADHV